MSCAKTMRPSSGCSHQAVLNDDQLECICKIPYTHSPFAVQGCVEIVYVTLQTLIFVLVVYWMCWFQRDAGWSTLLKLFVDTLFASVMCCFPV